MQLAFRLGLTGQENSPKDSRLCQILEGEGEYRVRSNEKLYQRMQRLSDKRRKGKLLF